MMTQWPLDTVDRYVIYHYVQSCIFTVTLNSQKIPTLSEEDMFRPNDGNADTLKPALIPSQVNKPYTKYTSFFQLFTLYFLLHFH